MRPRAVWNIRLHLAPLQAPAIFRRKYFLNGVPAFTYPGFTYTERGRSLPTPCCAVDTVVLRERCRQQIQRVASKGREAYQLRTAVPGALHVLARIRLRLYLFDVNKAVAWGPNPYNRNSVFVANTIYELPVGRGKTFMSDSGRVYNYLIGGWEVTNTLT